MEINQKSIIAWASLRVNYLDNLKKYEDSYSVSQEFIEWTTCLNVYPEGIRASTLIVPTFNKENRTG
tara:strand:+ start:1204 stop:1404 length:201 start_codon:yes stop_codon:yes gene_type:complete